MIINGIIFLLYALVTVLGLSKKALIGAGAAAVLCALLFLAGYAKAWSCMVYFLAALLALAVMALICFRLENKPPVLYGIVALGICGFGGGVSAVFVWLCAAYVLPLLERLDVHQSVVLFNALTFENTVFTLTGCVFGCFILTLKRSLQYGRTDI